jgi:hypothetical protein
VVAVEEVVTSSAVAADESGYRHIFISHADEDRTVSLQVVRALETDSFRCWIAHRDIAAGSSWMGAIVNAIVASRLMVVVVSRHSVDSQHVLREVTIADDERVPFLPFCIDGSPLSSDFRFFFSTAQRLDAFVHSQENAIELLRQSVAKRLGSIK